jgi:hypothetical protein
MALQPTVFVEEPSGLSIILWSVTGKHCASLERHIWVTQTLFQIPWIWTIQVKNILSIYEKFLVPDQTVGYHNFLFFMLF